MIQLILVVAIRFVYRFVNLERKKSHQKNRLQAKNVMVIGAGRSGQMLLKRIKNI
ncbi:MAG: hypothetical protein L6V88_07830 [Anaerotruncus sp.]|nr:MAG: hypothetical protein L6V88_07830 [Anaerotruncus sp.]